MRAIVALLILATFAGCADTETPEPSTDTPVQSDGNTTVEPDVPSEATSIVPSLTLDLVNGSAPLLVNFTVDAAGGDANTTWSLDFGDGNATEGLGVPATLNHTYELLGNFTAILSIGNATSSQAITVLAGGPPSGEFVAEEIYEFSGTFLVGSEIPLVQGCGADSNSRHLHDVVIPAEVNGLAVQVAKFDVFMDFGTTNLDSDVRLWDPAGNNIGESTEWNYFEGSFEEHFVAEGSFAPGTYVLEAYSCVAAEGDYDVTITTTYVTA